MQCSLDDVEHCLWTFLHMRWNEVRQRHRVHQIISIVLGLDLPMMKLCQVTVCSVHQVMWNSECDFFVTKCAADGVEHHSWNFVRQCAAAFIGWLEHYSCSFIR